MKSVVLFRIPLKAQIDEKATRTYIELVNQARNFL